MLKRIKQQGLDITPRIIIVSLAWNLLAPLFLLFGDIVPYCDGLILFSPQLTRLLPDAVGTTCGERLEKVYNTEYSHILRVPFRTEKGIVRRWISRFEVWPYLETYAEVNFLLILSAAIFCFLSDKCSIDFWFLLVLGSKKYQFFLLSGCDPGTFQGITRQAWSHHRKLQWWEHCGLMDGTQIGCYTGLWLLPLDVVSYALWWLFHLGIFLCLY